MHKLKHACFQVGKTHNLNLIGFRWEKHTTTTCLCSAGKTDKLKHACVQLGKTDKLKKTCLGSGGKNRQAK
jgi:hypothetical protein